MFLKGELINSMNFYTRRLAEAEKALEYSKANNAPEWKIREVQYFIRDYKEILQEIKNDLENHNYVDKETLEF